jgi:hypothetical protein
MYEGLGLKDDDEKDRKAREEPCGRRDPGPLPNECVDELVGQDDKIAEEMLSLCDWMNPIMELLSRYKDMTTFQLAMRQYAIKKELELGTEASTKVKYRGYCRGGDCPWKIHARVEEKGAPTNIVCFLSLRNSFVAYLV